MAANSEITAIRSCGVSFHRMLVPYFFSAAVIAILSFVLSSYVIPPANAVRLDFENKYIKNAYRNLDNNIHKQVEPGTFIYMENYRNWDDLGIRFSMERFDTKTIKMANGDTLKVLGDLKWKLIADDIKWDSTMNKWRIHNYYIRHYGRTGEMLEFGRTLDTTLRIKPDEFNNRLNIIETMNSPELNEYIDEQKLRGSNTLEALYIEKYKRTAFPFSTFILTLIGASFASKRMRGGIGTHIGLGILISFAYILFMQLSFEFSMSGTVSPLLAVWIPNIIFGIISVIAYLWAPK
jgi:lipopolysaccharide export system permease protein